MHIYTAVILEVIRHPCIFEVGCARTRHGPQFTARAERDEGSNECQRMMSARGTVFERAGSLLLVRY